MHLWSAKLRATKCIWTPWTKRVLYFQSRKKDKEKKKIWWTVLCTVKYDTLYSYQILSWKVAFNCFISLLRHFLICLRLGPGDIFICSQRPSVHHYLLFLTDIVEEFCLLFFVCFSLHCLESKKTSLCAIEPSKRQNIVNISWLPVMADIYNG